MIVKTSQDVISGTSTHTINKQIMGSKMNSIKYVPKKITAMLICAQLNIKTTVLQPIKPMHANKKMVLLNSFAAQHFSYHLNNPKEKTNFGFII